MTERQPDNEQRLAPAGVISRIGKAIVGLLQLQVVAQFLASPGIAWADRPIANPSYFIIIGLALALLPVTINIGFGRSWGRWPLVGVLAVAALAACASKLTYGTWWGPPVSFVNYATALYVHGHMGACHLLAAIIGTPGCEMRAPADLFARIRGQAATFASCPGFWTPLDNWEHQFRSRHA